MSSRLKTTVNDAGVRGIEEVPKRILRTRDLAEMLGISKTSIRRMAEAGEFPPAISLGPRMIGWHLAEIEEWLSTRERVALKP